ncbi:MFS transporter [Lacisediminimonas sp.]|uniref:MFS transporter n=1 Tax=Lacisediminimonas sp. TaxID=3060582 RepID=UPI00271C1DBD|nr:MFS transporter [Lacisediminimonas sp.]MDO8299420.1 MFS transporter [Lacisediminimonas sp.]
MKSAIPIVPGAAPGELPDPPVRLALLMWMLAVAFYLFGFFHRVTPAVLTTELMQDFQLSAVMLGNLSAFYFYFYAAMQLPTGVLVDRFGPRRLLWIGAVIGGVGALLFAFADTFLSAALGRGLIGATVAVAWVSMLKLCAHWFNPHRLGTVTGLSLAVGTMGAVMAGLPLRALSDTFGWRPVMAASGAVALLLAAGIFFVMRDDPQERGFRSQLPAGLSLKSPSLRTVLTGLGRIWRYRNVALLFWVPSGICGAFLTFTGLWGVPFLVQLHGLTPRSASLVTSGMLVAFSVGSIAVGILSDRLRLRKLPYVIGSTATLISYLALYIFPDAPLGFLVPLLLLGAAGSGGMAVGFLFARESAPLALSGTVAGAVNMGVMIGPLAQQPLIGWILDSNWRGGLVNGVRVYDLHAYQLAFGLLLVWVASAWIALLATRETHCKQYHEP